MTAADGPAIAVLPYGHRQRRDLCDTPLDALTWPLGRPDRLAAGRIGDLSADDHLIVFPRTVTHFHRRHGIRAQFSLLQCEPAAIHRKHLRLLRFSHHRFFRVLTFNGDLLARLPNAVRFPYGTTWVPEWRELSPDKTAMVSLIASAKRDSEGHRLRHRVVDWVRATGQAVDVMGRGYKPFERKADGLAPYRYSVVIENVREPNYFTEKLIDAILCDTVPIYWGCPNLADFIDTSGIILCDSIDDIQCAVQAASVPDYQDRRARLLAMKQVAARYCDLEKRAALAVRAALS